MFSLFVARSFALVARFSLCFYYSLVISADLIDFCFGSIESEAETMARRRERRRGASNNKSKRRIEHRREAMKCFSKVRQQIKAKIAQFLELEAIEPISKCALINAESEARAMTWMSTSLQFFVVI